MTVTVRHGDMLDVLADLEPASVDSVVTDPPYGLSFMGRSWDHGVPGPDYWAACLRVLKPGGHLLAFGGTRTAHRLTSAVEDAGFEIRDTITWLHGQGFPKGKGQLKPASEPIIVARKRALGPWLNIDATRVGTEQRTNAPAGNKPGGASYNMSVAGMPQDAVARETSGRWPTNVVLTHAPCCGGQCVDGCPVRELDAQSGVTTSTGGSPGASRQRSSMGGGVLGARPHVKSTGLGDTGGASRFFPTFRYQAKASSKERPKVDGVAHPTVKPLALMRWLVRLVTPPGGTVLDPFAGSGTTGEAAQREGFDALLIEREAAYLPLIAARLERVA